MRNWSTIVAVPDLQGGSVVQILAVDLDFAVLPDIHPVTALFQHLGKTLHRLDLRIGQLLIHFDGLKERDVVLPSRVTRLAHLQRWAQLEAGHRIDGLLHGAKPGACQTHFMKARRQSHRRWGRSDKHAIHLYADVTQNHIHRSRTPLGH